MNEYFSWNRKLNIKKVIIVAIIVAILLILLISFIVSKFSKHKVSQEQIKIENDKPTKIYTSTDNSFSLELSKKYELVQNLDSSDYLLDLVSESNHLGVHISKINGLENKNFREIAKADRLAYSQSFSSYSNLSDLKELLVGDTTSYTYTFHYLDSTLNKPCYIQIIWLNIYGNLYCIDINFLLDDLTLYTNLITETLSSFKKLN